MPDNQEIGRQAPKFESMGVSATGSHNQGSAIHQAPSAGGKVILGLVTCLLLAGAGIWWVRQHSAPAAPKPGAGGRMEMPAVPVVMGTVAEKDVPIYLEGLGTAQAFNTVTVRARVDGQLQRVAFVEGQDVKAGDLLAQIDPDPFRTALEQAAAKKGQDDALLTNARVDLARYAELLGNEGVTQQVYDTQKALVNQLEAVVKADQATVENAKVQLAYTTIISPIDGRTGMRLIDQGNLVRASESGVLVVIAQLRPISVVFTLPQQTLRVIHQASVAGQDLKVVAVERDNTTVLGEGKVAVIDNQIDTSTGTIKVKATFPNEDLSLWPGQFVNARLLVTVRKNSAVVPASVIQRGPESAFAFVIVEDPEHPGSLTVVDRKVKVAQIEQGEALIEDGLRPGERVVVDGQYKLQRGSRVRQADGAVPSGERGGRPGQAGGAGKPPVNRTGKAGTSAESDPGQAAKPIKP